MNAQTKHTPGPWEVHGNNIVATKGNVDVAVICYSGEHFTGEDKANARLIAAAPELLEALRNVVGAFTTNPDPESRPISATWLAEYLRHRKCPRGERMGPSLEQIQDECINTARAAIAKAVTP